MTYMTCKKSVLLAMPVYNEEQYVNDVLDEVRAYVEDVVVIDDGSTDRTKMILAEREGVCVISHPENRGYGQSIIDAFHFAIGCQFKWVLTMDCDLQHEPARIPDFLEAMARDDADVISGSRYMLDSQRNHCPPPDRQRINKVITDEMNARLGLKLTDGFCGFKAYRVSEIEKLQLTETGYALPLEFWVQVARHGLRVREIPVSLIYNDPNRHFGGNLDDPETRLAHYREVLERSLGSSGGVRESQTGVLGYESSTGTGEKARSGSVCCSTKPCDCGAN